MSELDCKLCGHSLVDNSHGFDQNDAIMVGDELVHCGHCTYCKECNPTFKEAVMDRRRSEDRAVPEVRTTLATQLDMDRIIQRCFDEAIETGIAENASQGIKILDRLAFSKHLQKTLIGELLEFEIIRRISPIFREIPRLENDLNLIHRKLEEHNRLIGMKTGEK